MPDNGIVKIGERTLIFNGGNPLRDCPTDWDEAREWIAQANGDKEDYEHPVWSFDCGFKLDFDGAFISISSRFYPPTSHGGETWDGTLTVNILGTRIQEKSFDCETLEDLKKEVEKHIEDLKKRFVDFFNQ